MRITLIGAGNLATNLGKALVENGHEIMQVYSKTLEAAKTLSELVGGIPTDDMNAITDSADVYVYSVKDSALREVIQGTLYKTGKDKVLVHTAGSIPMDCFAATGNHYGVLYPMQTFSKARDVEFREIPCFIEGNDDYARKQIRLMAESISDAVYDLSSENRKYLHLSAVWACNFANHCYTVASELIGKCGIPFDVLLPLINETARKVNGMSPQKAQTGPALRYDTNVIEAQTALLGDDILLKEIYKKMSESIHIRNKEK